MFEKYDKYSKVALIETFDLRILKKVQDLSAFMINSELCKKDEKLLKALSDTKVMLLEAHEIFIELTNEINRASLKDAIIEGQKIKIDYLDSELKKYDAAKALLLDENSEHIISTSVKALKLLITPELNKDI